MANLRIHTRKTPDASTWEYEVVKIDFSNLFGPKNVVKRGGTFLTEQLAVEAGKNALSDAEAEQWVAVPEMTTSPANKQTESNPK